VSRTPLIPPLLLLALLATAPLHALVGDWHIEAPAGTAQALVWHGERLWVGAPSGIQRFTPALAPAGTLTTAEGLPGLAISGLAVVQDSLYALGAEGFLSTYDGRSDRFVLLGRGFADEGYQPRPDGLRGRGSLLVALFDEGVALVERRERRSLLTVDFLQGGLPQQVSLQADSLFVLLDSALWGTRMDWEHPLKTADPGGGLVNHADPSSWSPCSRASANLKRLGFRTGADSLIVAGEGGAADETFLGSGASICRRGQAECATLAGLPVAQLLQLEQTRKGKLLLWSGDQILERSGDSWLPRIYHNMTLQPEVPAQILSRHLRLMTAGVGDSLYLGSYGWRAMGYDLRSGEFGVWQPRGSQPCPGGRTITAEAAALLGIEWQALLLGVAYAPDRDGLFLGYWGDAGSDRFGISYIDAAGDISCVFGLGGSDIVNNLRIDPLDASRLWAFSEGDPLRFVITGVAPLALQQEKRFVLSAFGSPFELKADGRGRRWLLSEDALLIDCAGSDEGGVCPAGVVDTLVRADVWLGMPQQSFTAMAYDGHGTLWLGTREEGLFSLDVSGAKVSREGWHRVGVLEGLAASSVTGLQADSATGDLWILHPQALSRLETRGRSRDGFGAGALEPRLFPNPWRPAENPYVTWDRLPEGVQVSLYSRAGRLVRRFRGSELAGGVLQWDGTNEAGARVAPGVYNWLVHGAAGTWKGRLLLVL